MPVKLRRSAIGADASSYGADGFVLMPLTADSIADKVIMLMARLPGIGYTRFLPPDLQQKLPCCNSLFRTFVFATELVHFKKTDIASDMHISKFCAR
jgi:hypothetical protein